MLRRFVCTQPSNTIKGLIYFIRVRNTHDLSTTAGWWSNLEIRGSRGQLSDKRRGLLLLIVVVADGCGWIEDLWEAADTGGTCLERGELIVEMP